MFVLGGEAIAPEEESMDARLPPPDGHQPPPKPLLLMLVCHSGEGKSLPVTREIQIGCIKTPLVKKVRLRFHFSSCTCNWLDISSAQIGLITLVSFNTIATELG